MSLLNYVKSRPPEGVGTEDPLPSGRHNTPSKPQEDGDETLRKTLSWIVVVSVSLFALFGLGWLIYLGFNPLFSELYYDTLKDHFRAVIGLPMAAAASLFIVLVLRATHGRIEFDTIGMKFKGASGPIVLWLISFLGITLAIKHLW